jgi:hypothetical protein
VGAALLGVNYVLSKSIDNGSTPENNDLIFGAAGSDQIQNAFRPEADRAPSNFDARHNFNAHGVLNLPGQIAVTGIWRWRSGFPLSVTNGVAYPTNPRTQGPATVIGAVQTDVTESAPNGAPNLFSDPAAALAQFAYTRPGESGSRNAIRGPAYFAVDLGVHKRFALPWALQHRLELRAIVFNALNSVNFATSYFQNTRSLNSATFGTLGGLAGSPRQAEFAIRYEF